MYLYFTCDFPEGRVKATFDTMGKIWFFSIYNENLVTKDNAIGVYFPLSVVQVSHDVFDVKYWRQWRQNV